MFNDPSLGVIPIQNIAVYMGLRSLPFRLLFMDSYILRTTKEMLDGLQQCVTGHSLTGGMCETSQLQRSFRAVVSSSLAFDLQQ